MVHINDVNWKDTDVKGNKLISPKSKKPYYKVGIQTNEDGEWHNGLLNFIPDKWKGTDQDLVLYIDPKWGKSFKLPDKQNVAPAGDINRVEVKVDEAIRLLHAIFDILGQGPEYNRQASQNQGDAF